MVRVTSLLIIFTAIILPGLLGLSIRKLPSGNQPSLTDAQAINQDLHIKQTFIARNPKLSAIGLSIKNPYYRNHQDLIFELHDSRNQLLRHIVLNGNNIIDGSLMLINFEPVDQSANREFYFTLSAPSVASANSLEIYHSQDPSPADEEYFVNNQLNTGELAFISYSTPSNPISSSINVYRDWFYKLFQDLGFAIFYLILIGSLTVYLILQYPKKHFS